MADAYLCRVCKKTPTATKSNRYRSHSGGDGNPCQMSSEPIPEDLLAQPPSTGPAEVPEEGKDFAKCDLCGRSVQLTEGGRFWPHQTALRGAEKCQNGGEKPQRPVEDVPLPGDGLSGKGVYSAGRPKVTAQMEVEQEQWQARRAGPPLAITASAETGPPAEAAATASEDASPEVRAEWPSAPDASSGASTGTSSPESTSTSPDLPTSGTGGSGNEPPDTGPFSLGVSLSETIFQPWSPFLQPPDWTGAEKPGPMGDYAKELATRIKETFYSYSNRKSVDNRSAQTTLGPSEIGTPCDRRLAMALMGVPAVNPGGDGWASFVGTCGHTGMGEIYQFADAGTGRYAVELPLTFRSISVPRGTTDLLDRRYGDLIDWKFMGAYSLKKFKLEGPSVTYRTQGHVYGLGAEQSGEKVRNIVIVGLPRAGSSMDEMHVWTEPFDRKFAQAALDRVQKIADEVEKIRRVDGLGSTPSVMATAQTFPTDSDSCRYCPFHLKNDKEMVKGCPGS